MLLHVDDDADEVDDNADDVDADDDDAYDVLTFTGVGSVASADSYDQGVCFV